MNIYDVIAIAKMAEIEFVRSSSWRVYLGWSSAHKIGRDRHEITLVRAINSRHPHPRWYLWYWTCAIEPTVARESPALTPLAHRCVLWIIENRSKT